jgi:hypothetical protein
MHWGHPVNLADLRTGYIVNDWAAPSTTVAWKGMGARPVSRKSARLQASPQDSEPLANSPLVQAMRVSALWSADAPRLKVRPERVYAPGASPGSKRQRAWSNSLGAD